MALVPFHRMGKPEEIAEMVVWLCSDRASYRQRRGLQRGWRVHGDLKRFVLAAQ